MLLPCVLLATLASTSTHAELALRSAEQAFAFEVESISDRQAKLQWQIPDGYYLYQHQFQVQQKQQAMRLNLPPAQPLQDDNYGDTHVYYQQVAFEIPTQANMQYQVTWQGCAKDRICYPPQTSTFNTDATGLVTLQNRFNTAQTLDLSQTDAAPASVDTEKTALATDQAWSNTLAERSFFYMVCVFLGLGFLLAFTPCSLPMLPIVSSILLRQRQGMHALSLAGAFVFSMATVYALLGLLAASFGLGLQRWLQQPLTLMAFSGLFMLFAINLFGGFELHLPRRWVQKLDGLQAKQQGGSYFGAVSLGVLSALLVGPCMTAPLAGALLFISQTQQQWQGAILLFSLGLGMGIPLLLISFVGAKVLPAVGQWMQQVKHIFGFMMLAVAVYFIRPLCPTWLMQTLTGVLGLSFMLYLVVQFKSAQSVAKICYSLLFLTTGTYLVSQQWQYQQQQILQNEQLAWHTVTDAAELNQALANAPSGQPILIDVYADWCIACQPIEQKVLTDAQVQQELQHYYLIKLDLSQYNASHQALLAQWQILGPPSLLFLDPNQQENRALRQVGSFNQQQLLEKIKQHEW